MRAKISLALLLTALSIGTFTACQKSSQTTPPSGNLKNGNNQAAARLSNSYGGATLLAEWECPDPPCCLPEPADCLPEVIIRPSLEAYVDFTEAVTEGPGAVSNYFNSDEWSSVFPNIPVPSNTIDFLRSGNAKIFKKPKSDGKSISWIVTAADVTSPGPDNMEFILQTRDQQ